MSEEQPPKFYFEREEGSSTELNGKNDYKYFSQEEEDVTLESEIDVQDK